MEKRTLVRVVMLVLLWHGTLLLHGCSDSTNSPVDPNTNGGSKDFAIVALSLDSVYVGESVIVTLAHAKRDTFSAFLHTVPLPIDSIWRDTSSNAPENNASVRFRIPTGASTGSLRIYNGDTVQARGNRTLVVLPSPEHKPMLYPFEDTEMAYIGDKILLHGNYLPVLRRNIEVKLNDVEMPVVAWDSSNLIFRVAPQAQSGEVRVRLFDSTYEIGRLEIVEPQGNLLQSGEFSYIQTYLEGFDGVHMVDTADTGDTISTPYSYFKFPFIAEYAPLTVRITNDSIVADGLNADGVLTTKTTIRLKIESPTRVSGSVSTHQDYVNGNHEFIEMQIRNMQWYRVGNGYRLRSVFPDIASELVAFRIGVNNSGFVQVFKHENATLATRLTIEF